MEFPESTPPRHVRLSDIAAVPWKNGGGVTRELATGGATGGDAGWGWRVSLAEVARDGPFSAFPGVDRVIAVIEGAGMDLIAPDGTALPLEPFEPLSFAGEEPLSGRLRAGQVRDLNVMVQREHYTAAMEFLRGPRRANCTIGEGGALLILGLAGRPSVGIDGAPPLDLVTGEILVHEGRGNIEFQLMEGSRAALIQITAR